MNDLPDELLDNVALFASPTTLRALALVEQRWYAPARQQTWFDVQEMNCLLAFAEMLIERPAFADVVRHLELEGGNPATASILAQHCSDLPARVICVILQKCRYLRALSLGGPPHSITSQRQLMRALGMSRHLLRIEMSSAGLPIFHSAFAEAAPALQSLQYLHVAFRPMETDPGGLLPFPPCSAAELSLVLYHCCLDNLGKSLAAVAGQARRLTISTVTDGNWMDAPSRARFNNIILPYIIRSQHFRLRLHHNSPTSQPDPRHLLDWPARRGGICFSDAGTATQVVQATWLISDAATCVLHVRGVVQDMLGVGKKRGWARRGDGWTSSHVTELEVICREEGVELVWE